MADAAALLARIMADLAELRALLDVPEAEQERQPVPEAFLALCQLADRLGIGEAYTRKLIRRGIRQGLLGFEKRRGRLFATAEAVAALRVV